MTAEFLSETETNKATTCCVCNRHHSKTEYGWVYSAMHNVYTCSNECYTSDKYEMLLTENKTNG